MQVGNSSYVSRPPAAIPLASDTDDANAPTYVSFQGVSNTTLGDHPAPDRNGQFATATINKAGQVGDIAADANFPGTSFVYFDPTTHHNVPKAVWDFLNAQRARCSITATGQTVNGRLSDPWFYATGLPISEPYWAKVKIANQPNQDVLIQAFERRVVTYVPGPPPDFRVQMSNIGQHYHDWRYSSSPAPVPSPTSPVVPTPAATATPVPQNVRPNSDFGGTWLNDNENTKEVAKLWIDVPDEHSLKITWFGPCGDSICENDGKIAPYTGEPFNITLSNRLFSLSFGDADATELKVGFGDGTLLFHRVLARDYFGTWLNDDFADHRRGQALDYQRRQTMTVRWFSVCGPSSVAILPRRRITMASRSRSIWMGTHLRSPATTRLA